MEMIKFSPIIGPITDRGRLLIENFFVFPSNDVINQLMRAINGQPKFINDVFTGVMLYHAGIYPQNNVLLDLQLLNALINRFNDSSRVSIFEYHRVLMELENSNPSELGPIMDHNSVESPQTRLESFRNWLDRTQTSESLEILLQTIRKDLLGELLTFDRLRTIGHRQVMDRLREESHRACDDSIVAVPWQSVQRVNAMITCMYFLGSQYATLGISPVEYSIDARVNGFLGITNEEFQVIVDIPSVESQGRIRELEKLIMMKVFQRYINLSSMSVDAEFITNSVIRDKPEMVKRVIAVGLSPIPDDVFQQVFPIVWDMDFMATLLPASYRLPPLPAEEEEEEDDE